MTRFSYLEASPPFAAGLTAIEIDNRIRGPLAALVATIVVSLFFGSWSLMRLQHAQAGYRAATARLAAAQPKLRELAALRARKIAAERLRDRVAAIRRANVSHADELVWIGNHLPAGVWLERLRFERDGYVIEGSSERAADIGTALITLHAMGGGAVPELMWLHADQSARVRYALRLRIGA